MTGAFSSVTRSSLLAILAGYGRVLLFVPGFPSVVLDHEDAALFHVVEQAGIVRIEILSHVIGAHTGNNAVVLAQVASCQIALLPEASPAAPFARVHRGRDLRHP